MKRLIIPFCSLFLLVNCEQNETTEEEFTSIFDGKTLNGWVGNQPYWSIKDGAILGEITENTKIDRNRFLIYEGDIPSDFELKAEYRISDSGNSGINYRSNVVEGVDFHALKGYQCDIDGSNNYTGSNYEERIRSTLASIGEKVQIPDVEDAASLKYRENNAWSVREVTASLGSREDLVKDIKSEEWNEVHIIAQGNNMKHYINGILMSDVTDNDTANRRNDGKLGMQVHVGPPMTIEYKNIRIKDLTKD